MDTDEWASDGVGAVIQRRLQHFRLNEGGGEICNEQAGKKVGSGIPWSIDPRWTGTMGAGERLKRVVQLCWLFQGHQRMIYEDCRVQSFGADGEEAGVCRIKLDSESIRLEYEDDRGRVVYAGLAKHRGHYVLQCQERSGEATLHRMPGSDILEGFWREGDARGMWRIHFGGSPSLNQYLVCSEDESIRRSFSYVVEAATETDAKNAYLRQVYSKDEIFRESVLDRAVNMSFSERFYIATPQENYRFNETALTSVTDEVVAARVHEFFSDQPAFGDAFVAYMADGDKTRITDEIFDYIAVNSGDGVHVVEIASVPKLAVGK